MKVKASNIVWDLEDDNYNEDVPKPDLPSEYELELDDDQDPYMETADVLSDTFGWCVLSLDVEVIENTPASKF